jgi:DNA-binding MarR family transcriptional regulator
LRRAGRIKRDVPPLHAATPRRSSYLTLTEAGERLLADATPTFTHELADRLADVVSAKAREQSGKTLATLRKVLEGDQRLTHGD